MSLFLVLTHNLTGELVTFITQIEAVMFLFSLHKKTSKKQKLLSCFNKQKLIFKSMLCQIC